MDVAFDAAILLFGIKEKGDFSNETDGLPFNHWSNPLSALGTIRKRHRLSM